MKSLTADQSIGLGNAPASYKVEGSKTIQVKPLSTLKLQVMVPVVVPGSTGELVSFVIFVSFLVSSFCSVKAWMVSVYTPPYFWV